MNRLKVLLDKDGVEFTERVFNTSTGTSGLGPNPFVSVMRPWAIVKSDMKNTNQTSKFLTSGLR